MKGGENPYLLGVALEEQDGAEASRKEGLEGGGRRGGGGRVAGVRQAQHGRAHPDAHHHHSQRLPVELHYRRNGPSQYLSLRR